MTQSLRRHTSRIVAVLLGGMLLVPMAIAKVGSAMNTPATNSQLAARSALLAIATAGDRLVAVGRMGHIVYSDDQGMSWKQASVPVSVDLVALYFLDAKTGWASGHDGVVLRTDDGGAVWRKLLDGREAAAMMLKYYESLQSTAADDALSADLTEARRFFAEDGARPFLDIWFRNADEGFVVGAWGLILHTLDGGKTWEPWLHRVDNPKAYHLYAIRPARGQLWIVGERGLVLKLDKQKRRFVRVASPASGTLFGLVTCGPNIVTFGLLGEAYLSSDDGEHWRKALTQGKAGIVAGACLEGGTVVLADLGGSVQISRDGGLRFSVVPLNNPVPWTDISPIGVDSIALAGLSGKPRVVSLSLERNHKQEALNGTSERLH